MLDHLLGTIRSIAEYNKMIAERYKQNALSTTIISWKANAARRGS